MKFKHSIKVVSFDLDGTLINTLADIAGACNMTLEDVGLPTHPVSAYSRFVGNGSRKLCERASGLDGQQLDGFEKKYRKNYLDHLIVLSKPYENIREVLETLLSRGKKLVVFTNKPQLNSERIIESLLENIEFGRIIGQCADTPCKPDPAGILKLCEDWHIQPEEIAHIGDSTVDVMAAKNAGMVSIGAAWGFLGDTPFQVSPVPDRVAQTPLDILSIDFLK